MTYLHTHYDGKAILASAEEVRELARYEPRLHWLADLMKAAEVPEQSANCGEVSREGGVAHGGLTKV